MKLLHRLGITATIAIFLIINATAQNVGIGTSIPDSKLHVIGNIKSTTSGYGLMQSSGGVTMGTFVDATMGGLGTLTNHPLRFFTNNNAIPSMFIQNGTGNVGIGTTNPAYRLEVVGAIGCASPGTGFVHGDGTTSMSTYVDGSAGWFGTISEHPLWFYTGNGGPRMTINNGNGYVGIGTTDPQVPLHVFGNFRSDGEVRSTGAGYGLVHNFGSVTIATHVDANAGRLGTHTNHPLWFFTNSNATTPSMVIQNGTGNVGIGTTNPISKLDVVGGGIRCASPGYGFLHTSTATASIGTYVDASAGWLGTLNGHPLRFFTDGNLSPLMVIQNGTGNVGIGPATPVEKLDVIGNIKSTGTIKSTINGYGLMQSSLGVTMGTYIDMSSGGLGTLTNHPLWFFTDDNAIPSMVIQNITGFVGIRKTVPDADIHVKQSASSTTRGIILEYAENANDWRLQIDNDNDFSLWYNGILKTWFWDTDGSFHMASDRRLKKDIVLMESTLSKVMELEPATYHYLDAENADVPMSSGFMAQDVQALFPDLVSEKNGYLGLNYVGFIPVAIKAIQEQQEIIDEQEKRIAKLEAMVGELMTMREQPVQQGQ